MDQQQLRRLYEQECSYCVNPPSFQSWLAARQRREEYETRQESIARNSPDEDNWNK